MYIFFSILLLLFAVIPIYTILHFSFLFMKEIFISRNVKNVDKYSNIILSINSLFIIAIYSIFILFRKEGIIADTFNYICIFSIIILMLSNIIFYFTKKDSK